jgi:hypothetical protein
MRVTPDRPGTPRSTGPPTHLMRMLLEAEASSSCARPSGVVRMRHAAGGAWGRVNSSSFSTATRPSTSTRGLRSGQAGGGLSVLLWSVLMCSQCNWLVSAPVVTTSAVQGPNYGKTRARTKKEEMQSRLLGRLPHSGTWGLLVGSASLLFHAACKEQCLMEAPLGCKWYKNETGHTRPGAGAHHTRWLSHTSIQIFVYCITPSHSPPAAHPVQRQSGAGGAPALAPPLGLRPAGTGVGGAGDASDVLPVPPAQYTGSQ